MTRNFVLTDIHGQYHPMMKLFDHVKLNPKVDKLHVLGDLIDRGPHSGLVTKVLKRLQENHKKNVKVIIGNHEVMMRRYVFEGKSHMWLRYGGYQAIEDFNATFEMQTVRDKHLTWLANLPLFVADDEYFYVHAGLDFFEEIHNQYEDITFIEPDESYMTQEEYIQDLVGKRKIVHGHTPYPYVYDTGRFICCDTGASVLEDDVLTLVELNSCTTYSYKIQTGEIIIGVIQQKEANERVIEHRLWKESLK